MSFAREPACRGRRGRRTSVAESEVRVSVDGVLHIHSCPPALCPHVAWAVARALGVPVDLSWSVQPVAADSVRTDYAWSGQVGTAGRLAGALRGWRLLRFEVTEEPSPGCDGQRYSATPSLGLFHAATSANGDVMVGEDRLRSLLGSRTDLAAGLALLLGAAWDAELEPYRRAAEHTATARLTRVV